MQSKILSREIFPNIYWVKKDNQVLLYAPFKAKASIGWRARIAKRFIHLFRDIHSRPEIISLPTTVTIDFTHQCPLHCVYCSVDAGRDDVVLDLSIAYKAIDLVFENAQKLKIPSVGIVFGGGGEPTLAWDVLYNSIKYTWDRASSCSIIPQVLVATGGIISKSKIKWLAQNTTHIALSFDGPEAIQNIHRPLHKGRKSFRYVVRTAKTLGKFNANFSIRAAISDKNSNLVNLVRFFTKFKPKLLNFQPVVVCGRCHLTGWKGLDPDRFIKEFLKARKFSESIGVPLIFPGTRTERIIPEMCHAYNGTGFVVTNRGLISACERVLSFDDGLANLFMYGRYDNGNIRIDEQKLEMLKTLKVEKIPYCKNCFCRWHCCGGCLNDHLSQRGNRDNPFSERTNDMCYIAREISWNLLKEMALGD